MKKNIKNSQKGFTMIELLLYMGIFSILLVVLMQLFTAILDVHLGSQATSSVDQDGNYILARLSYDIRNGSDITVSIPPTIVSTCKWPDNPTCQLQITGTPTNTYTINSAGSILINSTDPLNSVNTKITKITFTKLLNSVSAYDLNPKPSVQIMLTIQSNTLRRGGVIQTKDFQTTIGVR